MPGARVTDLLKDSKISINDFRACQLECNNITKDDIFNLLVSGKVNFSESQTSGDIKEYVLSNKKNKVSFLLDIRDSTTLVNKVLDRDETCACSDRSENNFSAMFLPNEMVLKTLQENGFEFIEDNVCHQECLGVDTAYLHSVIKTGVVLNRESFPGRKPNPVYIIAKVNQSDTTRFWVEKGTRTRVLKAYRDGKECKCD
jgi:hypothetical protein